MKTHINKDTLELLAIISRDSPEGFILMSNESEYSILRDLGYVTHLKNDITRLTEKGEKTIERFLEILKED